MWGTLLNIAMIQNRVSPRRLSTESGCVIIQGEILLINLYSDGFHRDTRFGSPGEPAVEGSYLF